MSSAGGLRPVARVAHVEEQAELRVDDAADVADRGGQRVVRGRGLGGVVEAVFVVRTGAAAVRVADGDDLGDQPAALQALRARPAG